MSHAVRIGNGLGFWGDSLRGPTQLVERGAIDYLTMDFLAEVTMSILRKARNRSATAGYATDFVDVLERVLPACHEKGIKVVANAGGVNVEACADACEELAGKLGLHGLRIGLVQGDDIFPALDELLNVGQELSNLDTGEQLRAHLGEVQSANAYLGAPPIRDALASGADVVITGRVTDASLTLGPLMFEFGWSPTDLDRLAAGTIAGHIIECGTQCCGGNFDGWTQVPDMEDMGYPIVEVDEDGTFVVTKPEGTGGLVNTDTVTAQLLYEIGDPRRYLTADVTADFTSVSLEQTTPDRVRVTGARGEAPPSEYKVSVSLAEGWKATATLVAGGRDAVARANRTAELLWARLAADGCRFDGDSKLVELVGAGTLFAGMIGGQPTSPEPMEVLLRLGVRDASRAKVDRFGRELASLLLSGPPGLTGFAGGRPKPSEVIGFWPALVAKDRVETTVSVREVA
ncbi:MAG TPA: acyclic terpene utilization AtuA family protein [Acidimicrobiales bacterium]|nr:acyclic terpene utilization AtuA family protein [Acidimicrobiales bacterium]